MDNVQTPEEIAAELAASQVVIKEDEVRAKIVEELGFDPEIDKERIDKLVAKEVDSRKKLSDAIGQKIKHRTEAEELRKKVPPPPPEKKDDSQQDVSKIVAEELQKRDLGDLDAPDAVKREIADWAKFKGISVKEAARAPHIVSAMDAYKKQQQLDEATTSRTNRSGGGSKNYSLESPPDVDMSTEAGRKQWDEYKEAMRKAGN